MNARLLGLVWLAGIGIGCSDRTAGRLRLEGTVTYKNAPVVFGTIQFDPDPARGGSGPQGSADIADGQYKTSPETGPKPGPHIVRITGYAKKPDSPNVRPLFTDARVSVDIPVGATTFPIAVPDKPEK